MLGRTIFIHAGYPRTGTLFLRKRFEALDSKEICYLDFQGRCNDSIDPQAAKKLFSLIFGVLKPSDRPTSRVDVKLEIEEVLCKTKAEKILLSSPAFLGIANWRRVPEFVVELFGAPKIIMVVREQSELVVSNYQQSFKNHFLSLEDFHQFQKADLAQTSLEPAPVVTDFHTRHLSGLYEKLFFDDVIREYKKVIPQEDLLVMRFEDLFGDFGKNKHIFEEFLGLRSKIQQHGHREIHRAPTWAILCVEMLSKIIGWRYAIRYFQGNRAIRHVLRSMSLQGSILEIWAIVEFRLLRRAFSLLNRSTWITKLMDSMHRKWFAKWTISSRDKKVMDDIKKIFEKDQTYDSTLPNSRL